MGLLPISYKRPSSGELSTLGVN